MSILVQTTSCVNNFGALISVCKCTTCLNPSTFFGGQTITCGDWATSCSFANFAGCVAGSEQTQSCLACGGDTCGIGPNGNISNGCSAQNCKNNCKRMSFHQS